MGQLADLAQGWRLDHALIAVVAVLARTGPAIWLAPFLAGRLIPPTVRGALVATLALLIFPHVSADALALARADVLTAGGLLVKEALVGLTIGLLAALVFLAAQAAGGLIDTARGSAQAETSLALTGSQSTPFGTLLLLFTVVLFLSLGGHRLFLLALVRSYEVLPISVVPSVSGVRQVALLGIELTGELIVLAVSLAAPVIATVLLVDISLGWLNRFAPQMNAYFIAMPLKALLGVAVMMPVVVGLFALLPEVLDTAMAQLERGIELFAR